MLADHHARRTGDSHRRQPLLISRRKGPQIAVLASFLALTGWSGPQYLHTQTAVAAGAITIGATPGATINAQFDSQHVWPSIVGQQPVGTGGVTSFDRLNALNGSVLRIHAGSDGTYAGTTCSNGATPALPFNAAYTSANGVCVSPWDFRNLNSMILNSHDAGSGGTVTYAATTISDSSKSWQPSIWMGRRVTVGSQSRIVADNTATTLTVTAAWSPTPSAATAYSIPNVTGPTMINVRYLPDNMYGGTGPMGGNGSAQGGILDMGSPTTPYQGYASYMATLVNYYNKGIAPAGANPATPPPGVGPVTYWEIYNEPDYAAENPRVAPQLPTPGGITLSGATVTGGSLTAGSTYTYQVSGVTTGDGQAHTAASAAQTVTLTAGQNAVQVHVPRSASANLGKVAPGYFIYGRSGTPQLIGFAGRDSNGGTDLVWTDKGTGTPSGAAPANNTTGSEAPFDPLEYKRMWDIVVPAMKAVDPTIKVVGPAATNPISISPPSVVITAQTFSPSDMSWSDSRDYVRVLMTSANKPDVVSYHGYGGFQGATDSEQSMFDTVDNPSNSQAIVQAITTNILPYTGSAPLWHTETAPNAAFGDSRNLEAGSFGAAWYGHLFAHLSPLSPQLTDLFQFEFVGSPTFGLVAEPGTPVVGATAGDPYIPYWSIYEINKNFPRGSKLLPVTNVGAGLDVLAALVPPDFSTVHVLVVNHQPAATCCAGATLTPTVSLTGLNATATSQTIVSAASSLSGGPVTTNLGAVGTVALTLTGYSVAVLEFKTGVALPTLCVAAGLSSSPSSPQAPGGIVTFTATSTGCSTPEYKFFLQTPGGSWTAQTGFGGATWGWNTSGYTSGVYGVGVWARQVGSAASYEAYWIGTYTLSVGTCTAASVSASPASPQAPGSGVTFTASATGCSNPSFEFWALVPGRTAWVVIQGYGAANTFNWTAAQTAGSPQGTYQIGAWARQAGSSSSYDAYGIGSFELGSGSCNSAGLAPSLAPPQVPNAMVTFTASSNACTNPLYQFWLLPPGGSWTVEQAYSATTTWAWNTTGMTAGTYQVGVWAKASASAAGHDGYFIGTYQLNVGPCTAAGISPSPASPQAAGTAITFTATATGCSTPSYQFWVLPPSSAAWQIVQAYGTANTSAWVPAAQGPYRVGVWVRQAGSPTSYDSYAIVTFQST